MKNRNINIDLIKGIGIILMVGGHCGMPFTHFIYLFHMAIFFMASGYCFNASNSETMQDVLSFVKRKFKGLWFPYVLWMVVFSLLHNVFIKTGIYFPDPWSISEIEKNIIKSFFLHGHTQLGTLLSAIVWFFISKTDFKYLKCSKKTELYLFVQLILLLTFGFTLPSVIGCIAYVVATIASLGILMNGTLRDLMEIGIKMINKRRK